VNTKLFDEKVAKDARFSYDGLAKGATWRSDIYDYFISKCPDGEPWLAWAEHQGATAITSEMIVEASSSGRLMTEVNAYIFSHHVWGFLQHCVTDQARQTFKNNARRDGLNIWRELVLDINSQTACRRHGLRDKVQMQTQVNANGMVKQALADWESLYQEYREAGGEEMAFEDRRSQLLRILPTELRKDVFRRLEDFRSIGQIKEWIRVQTELEREWNLDDRARQGQGRARPLNAMGQEEAVEKELDEYDMEALMALGPESSNADILAVQAKFRNFGGRMARRPPAPSAGARGGADRLPGATRLARCINCGKEGHETKDCRAPRKEKQERPCWNCGKPGHLSAQCPNKPVKALEQPAGPHLGCVTQEAGWLPVRGARAGGAVKTPKSVTLGDFITKGMFSELRDKDGDEPTKASMPRAIPHAPCLTPKKMN